MKWLSKILDCFPLVTASRYNRDIEARNAYHNDHLKTVKSKHKVELDHYLAEERARYKEELDRVTAQVRRIADSCHNVTYRKSPESLIYRISVDLDYKMVHYFNQDKDDMRYIADAVCSQIRSDIITSKFVQLASYNCGVQSDSSGR